MLDLSPIEFAREATADLSDVQKVQVARELLLSVTQEGCFAALQDTAHCVARHADCLERAIRLAAHRDGLCSPSMPETAPVDHLFGADDFETAHPPRTFSGSLRGSRRNG